MGVADTRGLTGHPASPAHLLFFSTVRVKYENNGEGAVRTKLPTMLLLLLLTMTASAGIELPTDHFWVIIVFQFCSAEHRRWVWTHDAVHCTSTTTIGTAYILTLVLHSDASRMMAL